MKMKEFIWKIAGADIQILNHSNEESRRNFLIVGIFYLFINTLIFYSFFGLFEKVYSSVGTGVFLGLILTFLISNIYRINMMSLDPPSLPIPRSKGSVKAAIIIRYTMVALFALFVSKIGETAIFYGTQDLNVHLEVVAKYQNSSGINESELFFMHLKWLNKEHPAVWLITIGIAFIFLYPIYLKRKLFGNHEYFRIKYRSDTKLVEDSYAAAKDELDSIYVRKYLNYCALKKDPNLSPFIPEDYLIKKYTIQESKYHDPPFNTRKVKKENNLKSHSDFISLDWK